jgi:hypothetical protein
MPPHFVHGAGIGTGAAVVMTAQRHDRAARARPEFVRPRNADLFDGSLVRAEDSGGRGYLLLSPNESDALLASYGQVGVLDRTPTCVFKMQACSESIATSPRGFSGAWPAWQGGPASRHRRWGLGASSCWLSWRASPHRMHQPHHARGGASTNCSPCRWRVCYDPAWRTFHVRAGLRFCKLYCFDGDRAVVALVAE